MSRSETTEIQTISSKGSPNIFSQHNRLLLPGTLLKYNVANSLIVFYTLLSMLLNKYLEYEQLYKTEVITTCERTKERFIVPNCRYDPNWIHAV